MKFGPLISIRVTSLLRRAISPLLSSQSLLPRASRSTNCFISSTHFEPPSFQPLTTLNFDYPTRRVVLSEHSESKDLALNSLARCIAPLYFRQRPIVKFWKLYLLIFIRNGGGAAHRYLPDVNSSASLRNSSRMRSYTVSYSKPFRMHRYKKDRGGGLPA